MPKQKLKAWLPSPEKLRENKVISMFAPFLADPRLWQFNRASLTKAVYIGILCAFFPLPGQMPLAIIGALLFRANVPMSIALTWITNPITTIPVFWFAYYIGATILGEHVIGLRDIGIILSDLAVWAVGGDATPFSTHKFFSIKVFLTGLLICAFACSTLLSIAFHFFWKYRIAKDWQKRAGYSIHAPKFRTQKGHKAREQSKNSKDEDFSI